jgi:hypothetical protein
MSRFEAGQAEPRLVVFEILERRFVDDRDGLKISIAIVCFSIHQKECVYSKLINIEIKY